MVRLHVLTPEQLDQLPDLVIDVETLRVHCRMCGGRRELLVDRDALQAYQEGALVQDAFPGLSASSREIIIGHRSGFFVCDDCWGAEQ